MKRTLEDAVVDRSADKRAKVGEVVPTVADPGIIYLR